MITILSSERKALNFNYQCLVLTRPFPVIFALRTWAIWGRRKSILIMFVCATIVSHRRHLSCIPLTVCAGRVYSFGGNHRKGHLKQCRFVVQSFPLQILKGFGISRCAPSSAIFLLRNNRLLCGEAVGLALRLYHFLSASYVVRVLLRGFGHS